MSNELAILMQQNPALLQTGLDADTLAVAGVVLITSLNVSQSKAESSVNMQAVKKLVRLKTDQ